MANRSDCLICGGPIVYHNSLTSVQCSLCHSPHTSQTLCANGHFVCDACHASKAFDWIEKVCLQSTDKNPYALAIRLMKHPSVKMHGPEHHFLVPAVLLSCYYHLKAESQTIPKAIKLARNRSEKVPGGFCGFCGNCGAAVGTGIFVSIVLQATPLTTKSWSLCNKMTSESLALIAGHGGPRCCKRDTFLSIQAAIRFSEENLGIKFNAEEKPICEFSHLNKECLKSDCVFCGAKNSPSHDD